MRITNMLFVVAAATTVSLHGCGTSTKDFQNQVEQIETNFDGLHPLEGILLDLISAEADKIPASERRRTSKIFSAMYKKDAPVDPLTDQEWQVVKPMMIAGAPKKLRPFIFDIDRELPQMTREQKSRLKVAITYLMKRYQELAKRVN